MGDGATIQRAGRYWYFVDHLVPEEGAVVRLWVALPMNRPGQAVTLGELAPEPERIHEDPLTGNRIACFEVRDPPADGPLIFTADFEVAATEVRTHVDLSALADYDRESPEYARFTRSEPWIEITDEVASAARAAVCEETNPYLAARRIFDWVVREMSYEYPDMEDRGAAKSIVRRKGDCGEFSVVFVAIAEYEAVIKLAQTVCRIPPRRVGRCPDHTQRRTVSGSLACAGKSYAAYLPESLDCAAPAEGVIRAPSQPRVNLSDVDTPHASQSPCAPAEPMIRTRSRSPVRRGASRHDSRYMNGPTAGGTDRGEKTRTSPSQVVSPVPGKLTLPPPSSGETMRQTAECYLYSPSDLVTIVELPFATFMERIHPEFPVRALHDKSPEGA